MKNIALGLSVIVFSVGLFASASYGGPIPLAPLAPLPVTGESNLASFTTGAIGDISVDWIVQSYLGTEGLVDSSNLGSGAIGGSGFLYLYQVENIQTYDPSTGPQIFTVTFGTGSVLGAGYLASDLDVASALHGGHDLAGEVGDDDTVSSGIPLTLTAGFTATTSVAPGNISWTFSELSPDHETGTLFFVSTLPPVYGVGSALNGSPPSPWNSLADRGQSVPVPTPEPTTFLGLGVGLAAVLAYRRILTRRKFS